MPEVRQAINEALDREALVRDGMTGRGTPADGPLWPRELGVFAPCHAVRLQPGRCQASAGRSAGQARRKHGPNGPSRFSFTCLVFANDTRFERLAAIVQKQLADVGVDMKLLPVRETELVPGSER